MKTFFEFQKKREFFSSQKILFFSSIFNPSGLTHQNKSEAVKMSRHRNMKYITEEAFDEMYDEGYDEYYDEGIDQVELGKLKNKKMTFLDNLVNRVYDILGNNYPYHDIFYALKDNGYDLEKAIDCLLNPAEETIIAAPKKKKNKKNKNSKNKNPKGVPNNAPNKKN